MFDNDIPLPSNPEPVKRDWHFGLMMCGQSFAVSADEAANLRKAASAWKRRHAGWEYVTKPQPDGSLRLWCSAVPAVEPTYDTYAENLAAAIDDSVPETWAELQARLKRET